MVGQHFIEKRFSRGSGRRKDEDAKVSASGVDGRPAAGRGTGVTDAPTGHGAGGNG